MTVSSFSKLAVVVMLASVTLAAFAQTTQPSPRPAPAHPAPVHPVPARIVPPANTPTTYQQRSRDQQVRDQLQKNQVEEQLRQQRADTIRNPSTDDAAQQKLLDQNDQSQRDRYDSRQQDAVKRYQNATPPPPAQP